MSTRAVSDRAAERLLEDLVAIPSPSGEERDASEFLVDWMRAHGFRAYVDEAGSAVGIQGEGKREIVLLGHIDTFPGPLPVERKGRLLYGRGTVDAKGPLATFVVAAANLQQAEDRRVVVIGATEEEAPTSRGARHAAEVFQPDACLIGEPSGWERICLGYKGRLNLRWAWRGPLAHSSGPTPSPGEVAVSIWKAIRKRMAEFNDGHRRGFEQLQASLQSIHAQPDGAYGSAAMEVALRLPPRISAAEAERMVRGAVAEGDLEFYGAEEPYVAERANRLTRMLLPAIRQEGGEPRFLLKSGTSDMNVVGPRWSCPIVAYGPGNSRLDHTPEEHIHLDEYLRATRVLRRALETQWMGPRRDPN